MLLITFGLLIVYGINLLNDFGREEKIFLVCDIEIVVS